MKRLFIAIAIALFTTAASAGDPPKFFQDTYPEHALKSALDARGVLEGEGAALDGKTRELQARRKSVKPLRPLRRLDSGAPSSTAWDIVWRRSRRRSIRCTLRSDAHRCNRNAETRVISTEQ
jgi:hypothetical protein